MNWAITPSGYTFSYLPENANTDEYDLWYDSLPDGTTISNQQVDSDLMPMVCAWGFFRPIGHIYRDGCNGPAFFIGEGVNGDGPKCHILANLMTNDVRILSAPLLMGLINGSYTPEEIENEILQTE